MRPTRRVTMEKYSIGYRVSVFYYGEKTTYEYVGNGGWRCVSGIDTPARYEQLMELIGR